MKMENHYNTLLDLITDYQNSNCDFIVKTNIYMELDNFLKNFFGKDFQYSLIKKLYNNCFCYQKYVIKFNNQKVPLKVPKLKELVYSYYRNNFVFKLDSKIMYLGVEIQDYLYPSKPCSENDILNLYISLRQKGYIWIDANLSNALIYQGEPKIIDIDFIYEEKEANFINQSKLAKKFEEYYQNKFPKNN